MRATASSPVYETLSRERLHALPSGISHPGFGAPEFFEHFFRTLEERDIPYVILHGYADFPQRFDSDVDYAVRHQDLTKIASVLAQVAREHGWLVVQNVQHEVFAHYSLVVDPADAANHLGLDVCSHFSKDGCLLLSDAILLQGRHRHVRGFFVPAPSSEFAHLLAKIVTKPSSIPKYIERVRELAGEDAPGAERRFAELCGDTAQALEHFLRYPETTSAKLKAQLRARTGYGFSLRCAEFVRRLRRAARPAGLRISLLGPDGSGKSTLAQNLQPALAPCFQELRSFKFRPDVFGQIGAESQVAPHARAPRNRILSWAKTIFYFADWWLGELFKLRPARRRGALIVFDRDFSDLVVDQRRHLVQRSRGLASLLRRLLPQPDARFLLDADPQVIHARKPELPIPELERQRHGFRRLAASDRRIRVIPAEVSSAEVAKIVARDVLVLLAARERRRALSVAKRIFDVVVAASALLVLTPLLLGLALLVRVKLGTPVLFRQPRPGLAGLRFTLCKFRTMTDTRDARGNLLPDPERVTAFGRFLRSSSLDELPELLNVLRGDMSLVGPRPLLMEYLPLYSPDQMRRHDVRPGITGWAQINGRNSASWPRKFALDLWYVDHQSLWLDVKIIALTVLKVVRREGIHQTGRFSSERFRGEQSDVVPGSAAAL